MLTLPGERERIGIAASRGQCDGRQRTECDFLVGLTRFVDFPFGPFVTIVCDFDDVAAGVAKLETGGRTVSERFEIDGRVELAHARVNGTDGDSRQLVGGGTGRVNTENGDRLEYAFVSSIP